MYMRYTQGQNEEYLLSRSMYQTRYLQSGMVYVHEVYTGTIQKYVLNQVLSSQVPLYMVVKDVVLRTLHTCWCSSFPLSIDTVSNPRSIQLVTNMTVVYCRILAQE